MKTINGKFFLTAIFLTAATLIMTACGATNNGAKNSAAPNAVVQNSAASNSSEQSVKKVPPSEAVKVRADEITVRAGEAAEASVEILIADEYHVNANPASFPYLRPTEVKIETTGADGISVAGKPIYPKAESKKFNFAEEPIAVYHGTAKIKVPIRAAKAVKAGETFTLRGTLESQPCNDNACFPSRTAEFSLPVRIIP